MKKIFFLMAAALMSLTMMAGPNDLLWDYSEKKIPTSGPDNGLYYGAYVNDAPSTNLGLNGVKMNSSGYAYFTKAAVAGKLKLTFSPRKSGNTLKLAVWTWTGDSIYAQTLIKETAVAGDLVTEIIDLTAEQTNIYITRPSGTGEGVLQKVQFIESVPRTFVDFEMIMCNMTEEYDFATLPAGVTASGTFNNDQHGYRNFTITVPVDGTVKFTIGDCTYGNQPIEVKDKEGKVIATLTYPAAGCYGPNTTDKVFPYIYMGEANTLTFGPIQYCNYFKAEAAEIMPCAITFKDQEGNVLGKVDTYEGATLEAIPYDVEDLPAIKEGNKFRGWFYSNNKKAKVGDIINGNTTIQAKVTPVETATVGSVQIYNFADATFYPEDHETVEMNGGYYHDSKHGWAFKNGEGFAIETSGKKAIIVLEICQEGKADAVWNETFVTPKVPGIITPESCAAIGTEGQQMVFKLDYPQGDEPLPVAFTLQNAGGENYLHKVTVYNVEDFLVKDEATGYYIVPANDVASFIMALTQAEAGDKIFLPNGTYDLGEACLTPISKNNISIIGESMDMTVIKNAPVAPGIGSTATIRIAKNISGTYLQDLTLFDNYDYYKTNEGVGVALQDQGTQTICKNVKLMGYQDTYYSNLIGAVKYFENCEIHGTVDFICGDGSVYFYDTELICEQRSTNGGGSDALTASNADASDKGYVFDHCSVRYAEDIEGTLPVVSLGRSWNNYPKCVFLYTFLDDSNGKLNLYKDASKQKDKISRWTLGGMNVLPECFGEYYSVNAEGQNVTPASNEVTFVLNTNEKTMETVLTAEKAAVYTMDYTLGDWSATAKAEAKQEVCDLKNIDPAGIYLVETLNGNAILYTGAELKDEIFPEDLGITVRKANARGGFGEPAKANPETGIENANAMNNGKTIKTFRNGQLIIVRDNKTYNVLGAEL